MTRERRSSSQAVILLRASLVAASPWRRLPAQLYRPHAVAVLETSSEPQAMLLARGSALVARLAATGLAAAVAVCSSFWSNRASRRDSGSPLAQGHTTAIVTPRNALDVACQNESWEDRAMPKRPLPPGSLRVCSRYVMAPDNERSLIPWCQPERVRAQRRQPVFSRRREGRR